MAVYSIKDLEQLSGIKAHTLRIWEQRYRIVVPNRTPTNIRYYNDNHVKCLLNIALLNKNGVKISKIAKMSVEEIANGVAQISTKKDGKNGMVETLTIAMIDLDEQVFDKIISTDIANYGFEHTMSTIIQPFLEKLGVLWLTGSISSIHEQFISCIIRRKIIVEIDKIPKCKPTKAKKFIVFLPEGESQELSILFLNYILQRRGHRVIYLGSEVSINDLHSVLKAHQPDYVFTMLNDPQVKMSCQAIINKLACLFSKSTLIFSGAQFAMQHFDLPKHVLVQYSLKETIDFIDGLS